MRALNRVLPPTRRPAQAPAELTAALRTIDQHVESNLACAAHPCRVKFDTNVQHLATKDRRLFNNGSPAGIKRATWDLWHLDTSKCSPCSDSIRVYGAGHCLKRRR
jgi:hypothetical protein